MGKQELAALIVGGKLRRNLDGIIEMSQLPDALVVIDTFVNKRRERSAALGIPVVASWTRMRIFNVIDYPSLATMTRSADSRVLRARGCHCCGKERMRGFASKSKWAGVSASQR